MPGALAIVEAPGLAEFAHQFGKDGVVIAEELHQQPDQQAADGADQDGEEARIQTQRPCGLFPDQPRALMDEGHEGEGDQGAEQAEHDDERQELDVGSRALACGSIIVRLLRFGTGSRTGLPIPRVIRQGIPEAVGVRGAFRDACRSPPTSRSPCRLSQQPDAVAASDPDPADRPGGFGPRPTPPTGPGGLSNDPLRPRAPGDSAHGQRRRQARGISSGQPRQRGQGDSVLFYLS